MKNIWPGILLLSFSILAQEEEEFDLSGVDDIEVVEEKETGFWRKASRNFTGSIGQASIIGNGDSYRGYTHARLGFQYSPFSTTKIGLQGLFERTQIQFTQALREHTQTSNDNLEKEKKLKYAKNKLRAEEAYLSQELFDSLTLSYGIQQIVWGQFNPYSPTNLVFPFNLSTTDIEFTKVKGTLPQEAAVATFFPVDSISLSLYYFPKLTYDEVIERRFSQDGDVPVRLPSGSDKVQEGGRLMFYPSWGTVGFSYYKGFDTSLVFEEKNLMVSGNNYDKQRTLTFSPQEMVGFEVAIPVGAWVHKFEFARSRTLGDLSFSGSSGAINSLGGNDRDFFNALMEEKNGSLTIRRKQDIMALGTTADLDRWYFNLMLFYLADHYNDADQRLIDLEERAKGDDNDDSFDGPVYPGGVISRYLDKDKTSEISLAAGIIGNGAGAALFYTKTTDSFVFGAGVQSVEYFSDDTIVEVGADENYKRKNDMTTGLLLSAAYKF